MAYRVDYYKPLCPFCRSQDWRAETFQESLQLCEHETITPLVLERLPRSGKILEAGCGSGRWVAFLQKHGRDVVGIDYSTEGLQLLKDKVPGARVAAALVESVPFRASTFHAVFSHGVVEHFEAGPVVALREARRVLVDDGLLLLVVPYNNLWRRLVVNRLHSVRNLLRRRRGAQLEFCEYRFSTTEIERFLRDAGFVVAEMHPADMNLPRNTGLYVDAHDLFGYEPISMGDVAEGSALLRLLVSRSQDRELSRVGRALAGTLRRLSPWFACGMVLCVATAGNKGGSIR
jgi:SAM-dependent methyltransferase